MSDFDRFLSNILNDLRVELADEFDRNFERKAFFERAWPAAHAPNNRGSLMLRTGILRQSIQSAVSKGSITFSSSLPYASIHNEGGTITVTPAMKKYFWAKYYESSGSLEQVY